MSGKLANKQEHGNDSDNHNNIHWDDILATVSFGFSQSLLTNIMSACPIHWMIYNQTIRKNNGLQINKVLEEEDNTDYMEQVHEFDSNSLVSNSGYKILTYYTCCLQL